MHTLLLGTEKSDYDLHTGASLQINGVATTYTVLETSIFSGRIQLGNAAANLAGGERLQLDVIVTPIVTGDACLMPTYIVDVPVTQAFMLIEFQPFLVQAGDIIEIKGYSNDSNDNAVGGAAQCALLGIEL